MANDRLEHVGKLREIFERVATDRVRTTVTIHEFRDRMFRMASMASFAKVIEYNVAVNHDSSLDISHAIMSGGLRGICEDLIALKFMLRFEPDTANEIIFAAMWSEMRSGIKRQRQFLPVNSPHQMIVGALDILPNITVQAEEADQRLKDEWKKAGFTRRPKIETMAKGVSLDRLYDYLYFATSNYTHHNIRTLFMTGWGPPEGGDTNFSSKNLSYYYHAFNSFYGALLYCGFVWSGLPIDNLADHEAHATAVEDVLKAVKWWPEIVTRDEMNLPKPHVGQIMQAISIQMMEEPTGPTIFDDLKAAPPVWRPDQS